MTKPKKKTKEFKNNKEKQTKRPSSKKTEVEYQQEEKSSNQESADTDTKSNDVKQLQQKMSELQEEIESQKNQTLRHLADLENFRKRKQQEVDSFKEYAAEKVLLELLPIIDSFDLAVTHSENEEVQPKEVLKGFLLIRKQIQNFLEKQGVDPINALNKEFDPNYHQAISQEEAEDVESDRVIKEVQKGYKLKEKVIRPSMVVVST